MRLIDYLNLARERIVVVVAVIVVACAAVLAFTFVQTPEYAADARVRLSLPVPETDPVVREVQADTNTEAELVRSTQVANAVADTLGTAGHPDELLDKVEVAPIPNTAVIQITATDGIRVGAVRLVNAFARNFVEVRQANLDEALTTQGEALDQQQRDLEERHARVTSALQQVPQGSQQELALQAEQSGILSELVQVRSRQDSLTRVRADTRNRYEIIRAANDARAVRSTSPARALVFGLLIGLPLALAAILLLDSLRNTVRGRDDVESLTGVDVVGVIPYDRAWTDPSEARLAIVADPLSPVADAYRTLGHNLGRLAAGRDASTILVTSPGDGDGKTSVAVNLALVASDGARRTVLVEADLRHPRAHTFLGTAPDPGMTDVLIGDIELGEALQSLGGELTFLGAGTVADRPDLLIARAGVDRILGDLAAYDREAGAKARPLRPRASSIGPPLVVLDSSPVLSAAEVSVMAAAADAVLLVARVGVTPRQAVRAAADQLVRAGGNLLGAVVVGAKSIADQGWPVPAGAPEGTEASPSEARAVDRS